MDFTQKDIKKNQLIEDMASLQLVDKEAVTLFRKLYNDTCIFSKGYEKLQVELERCKDKIIDLQKEKENLLKLIEHLKIIAQMYPEAQKQIERLEQEKVELNNKLGKERNHVVLPPPPAFMPIVDYLIRTYASVDEMENMLNLLGRINADTPSKEIKQAYDKLNNRIISLRKSVSEPRPSTVVNGDMVGQKIQENFGNNYNLESGANVLPPDDMKKIKK